MFSVRRKSLTWSDVRVGLFIIVGIIVVAVGVFFFFKPTKLFSGTIKVRTIFSTVGGLTQGATVMISGVQVGTVENVSFINPAEVSSNQSLLSELRVLRNKMDQLDVRKSEQKRIYDDYQRQYAEIQSHFKHIEVVMSISSSEANLLRSDSIASLRTEGLVGDKYINISPATPEAAPLYPVTDSHGVSALEISSIEPPDLNAILNNVSTAANSLQGVVSTLNTDIKDGKGTIGKLFTDPSVHDNLNATLKASAVATKYTGDLLDAIRHGKGTLGKFFYDSSLYDSANSTLKKLQEGNGTLGRFIQDPSLYNNANAMLKGMQDVTNTVNRGDGSLQKFMRDPSLYRNSDRAVKEISELASGINQGKGSLGKLANDNQFYSNTSQAMADLASVAQKINHGEGTVGKLVQDQQLYNNLTALSGELLALVRDFKKNPKKYLTIHLNVIKFF